MKRILLALLIAFAPAGAWAQCNGVFPANTICGKLTTPGLPGALPNNVLTGVPGGTNQQIQFNNLSNFAGFTMVGDGRLTPSTGTFTLTPSGVTAASYGSGLNIPVITFDAKGRATIASEISPTAFTGGLSPSAGTLGAVPAPTAAMSALGYVLGANGNFIGLSRIGGIRFTTPIDHGALCDGATNDSAAIQRWLNSISGYAMIGLGIPNRECRFNGLLSIGTQSQFFLNSMTFKLINSGNANSGFVCGPTSQVGGPVDDVKIVGGIFDGNRTNQTNSLGGGAMVYCVSATNSVFEDVQANNGRADGFYLGGSTAGGFGGRSAIVTMRNVRATGNYRNNITIAGVDRLDIFGGKGNSAANTNGDGPMCGIDFEPDNSNNQNTNINMHGGSYNANGVTGATPSGASGICVFGDPANTTNIQIHGVNVGDNFHYGLHSFTPVSGSQLRVHGLGGTGNLSGQALNAIDYFPATITRDAANSCGAGFRCVAIPN